MCHAAPKSGSVNRRVWFVLTITGLTLITGASTTAGKPPGGGGGGATSTRFSVIELPIEGFPKLSEVGPDGIVTVAIDSDEAGYVSAAYAYVRHSDGRVLASGFLPEPPFVDPNDGVMKNGWSNRGDVNDFGDIVGDAATFDPAATEDPSPARAILWTDDGSGYEYTLLPMLPDCSSSRAFGINNWGDIVGMNGPFRDGVAVLWDAASQSVIDLNTPAIAAQGWDLFIAYDINDAGVIVGTGYLNGAFRGFVLDRETQAIWAVPLIGPAIANDAPCINTNGRVVGSAWDGEGRHYGTNPDYILGYSWSGPGAVPIALPSVTANTCHATDLNDLGVTVGQSYIPTDDPFAPYTVPTLWEFALNGDVITTDLQSQIPSKPYTLVNCLDVNNDLWIGVRARKFVRGSYWWPAAILVPNP